VFVWVRRIVGLALTLAAAGGVFSFVPAPHVVAGPVIAVPGPLPPARPIPLPLDPAHAIVYQRGYEPGPGRSVLVERWLMAGTAFRERVTVDGRLLSDRSDGREVDYLKGEWRVVPGGGLDDNCSRAQPEIDAGLANGTMTVSGPGVPVGGHETTVVRLHGTLVVDMWVSTTTHRAVRCRVDMPGTVTFDLVWLPATEANLAQLVAVIPDGFARAAVTDRS
jgi:hypothetical protein